MTLTYEDVVAILAPDEPSEAGMQTLNASAIPHLDRLLQSQDQSLMVKAAFALSRIPSPETARLVSTLAAHSLPVMRVAAAAAAKALPRAERESVLLTLLRDADAGVQKSALKSVAPEVTARFNAQVAAAQWSIFQYRNESERRLVNLSIRA